MKNNLYLFERPFKIQKNGVYLLAISFFVLEILTFFYYANYISDGVILFATKKWKILNKGCHFVSFLMHICGAKFQEHCFDISRDIV